MLDKSVIDKIEDLSLKGKFAEIDGKTFSTEKFTPILFEPKVEAIELSSLTALVDFFKHVDSEILEEIDFISIDSPEIVYIMSKIFGKKREREVYAGARYNRIKRPSFQFGSFIPIEEFIIKLRSMFVQTPELDALVVFVSKMSSGTTIEVGDDGITQNVTVKKGVSGAVVENKPAPVIIKLKPFRTFTEIDQIESTFLFRVRASGDQVNCALFEADGGVWQHQAMLSIKQWLKKELGDDITVIA